MKKLFLTLVIVLITMVGYSQTFKKRGKFYNGKELIKVDENGKTWIGYYYTEYFIWDPEFRINYVESVPSTWKVKDFLCKNCEVIDILKRDVISWHLAYKLRPVQYAHEKP
jgi:hypothetical protein